MMDKREVTNRQYKAFVDAGGYTEARVLAGRAHARTVAPTFEAAMAKFTDKTGSPARRRGKQGHIRRARRISRSEA